MPMALDPITAMVLQQMVARQRSGSGQRGVLGMVARGQEAAKPQPPANYAPGSASAAEAPMQQPGFGHILNQALFGGMRTPFGGGRSLADAFTGMGAGGGAVQPMTQRPMQPRPGYGATPVYMGGK